MLQSLPQDYRLADRSNNGNFSDEGKIGEIDKPKQKRDPNDDRPGRGGHKRRVFHPALCRQAGRGEHDIVEGDRREYRPNEAAAEKQGEVLP